MWLFLVLLGGLIVLAGLAVIVAGAIFFPTTFGNALITTGAVAASGGFVITAMGLVLRQLERLTARVEERLAAQEQAAFDRPEARAEPEPASARPRSAAPRMTVEDLSPPGGDEPAEAAPPFEPPAERPGSRIRPHAPPSAWEEPVDEEAAPDPMVEARRQRLERRGEADLRQPMPRPRAEHAATRPAPPPSPRAPGAVPAAAPPAPPPRRAEGEEPRILKSGIVGGMAYTLYSDGSIQADLPDGVVRFASLQELRDHVAQAQQG